jgi:hypothetical protein
MRARCTFESCETNPIEPNRKPRLDATGKEKSYLTTRAADETNPTAVWAILVRVRGVA